MRVLWVALAVVVADQLSKLAVVRTMFPHESIPVVGRLFRFTFTENPGMAFGLSLGSKLFLTLFSIAATGLIAAYLWHVRRAPAAYRTALALILGGALGNVIDRTFYGMWRGECIPPGTGQARLFYGCVVDFLHLDVYQGVIPQWVPVMGGRFVALFPIGNVADLAIIGGVVTILLAQRGYHEWLERRLHAAPAAATATQAATQAAPVLVEEGRPSRAEPADDPR